MRKWVLRFLELFFNYLKLERGGLFALPAEIVLRIFSKLNAQDLVRLQEVCQYVRSLALHDALWQALTLRRMTSTGGRLSFSRDWRTTYFARSTSGTEIVSSHHHPMPALSENCKSVRSLKSKFSSHCTEIQHPLLIEHLNPAVLCLNKSTRLPHALTV